MSMNLFIPDPLAEGLATQAIATGLSREEVALSAIQRGLASINLEATLAPIRKAFADSGLGEDESLEFLEAEKHALRQERRANE